MSAFAGKDVKSEPDDFTDVIVEMIGGEKYIATFFTREHLKFRLEWEKMKKRNYFWIKHLVVVASIQQGDIELVVDEMIEEGDFQLVFEKITND